MRSTKERIVAGFVVCVDNGGYDRDLKPLKLYKVVPDENLESGDVRVIDETDEDYIYPMEYFVPVELSGADEENVRRTMRQRELERSGDSQKTQP